MAEQLASIKGKAVEYTYVSTHNEYERVSGSI